MAGVPQPHIYPPKSWGAAPAKRRPALCGPPVRALLHGTAGHHAEITNPQNESLAELFRYARDVQAFHMRTPPTGRGWNDSGHDFLIGRNGVICAGRRWAFAAATVGLAVESAHCPGQNDQPGIELEHAGDERPTAAQHDSFVQLVAWLFSRCGARPTAIEPHSRYYGTACPTDSLRHYLFGFRQQVAGTLNRYGRDPATARERALFRARYFAHL